MANAAKKRIEASVNRVRQDHLRQWISEVFGGNATKMAQAAGISYSYLTKMLSGKKAVPQHLYDRIDERVGELKRLPAITTGAAESYDPPPKPAPVEYKPAAGPVPPGREVIAFAEAAEALSPAAVDLLVGLVSYRDAGSHLAANTRQALHHIAQIRHLKGVLGG